MTADVSTRPETIARQFAAAIRDDRAVDQLWLFTGRGGLELWVITTRVDDDAERGIFQALVSLIEQHPGVAILPRVLNPQDFVDGTVLADQLPRGAQRIALRG